MRTLALYNIKGGVGKTTATVNLAYLAAREGFRTLVWDLDPQGAASFYFRIRPKVKSVPKLIRRRSDLRLRVRGTDFEMLDLVPADFSYRKFDLLLILNRKPKRTLRKLLRPLRGSYDLVFLDCAPSISLVSESVFFAADALLVPTIPTTLSMRTLEQITAYVATLRRRRPEIVPFFSMVDRRRLLHRGLSEDGTAAGFLRARIPVSSIVESMGVHRAPLPAFARASAATSAFEELWTEVKERLQITSRR